MGVSRWAQGSVALIQGHPTPAPIYTLHMLGMQHLVVGKQGGTRHNQPPQTDTVATDAGKGLQVGPKETARHTCGPEPSACRCQTGSAVQEQGARP